MSPRSVHLSRRTGWDLAGNRLAARLETLRADGGALLDLTEANPTRCGLDWPPDALASAVAGPGLARYDPDPRGGLPARRAISEYLLGHGASADPERIVLTASTSEGYALLLKLLCDPGDEVLAPAPSYPLLDLLCDLEGVRLRRYPLRWDGTWHVDLPALSAAVTERTRAVVVVSPSNPVGALLAPEELGALQDLCSGRGLALLGDEVFLDTARVPVTSVASAQRCLAFHLSGLSKVCGLPQLKAAWIVAAGPEQEVARALARLEVVADTYLSVSGTAQLAIPELLAARERFLAPLRLRLAGNRAALARAAVGAPFDVLEGGGGWAAVVRAGEALDEERLCLDLLEEGVVVQPGFFYDFERPGFVVVSLLPEPDRFARGVAALAARLRAAAG